MIDKFNYPRRARVDAIYKHLANSIDQLVKEGGVASYKIICQLEIDGNIHDFDIKQDRASLCPIRRNSSA